MYHLSDLAKVSGVEADRLRTWQSRYSFLEATGLGQKKLYSEHELIKLVNIAILSEQGWRISKILELDKNQLAQIATELTQPSAKFRFGAIINGLIRTAFEFDQYNFVNLYNSARKRTNLNEFVIEICYPFMNRLELLWRNYKISIAQKSFVSELLKKMLSAEFVNGLGANYKKRILLHSELQRELLISDFIALYLLSNKIEPILLGSKVQLSQAKEVRNNTNIDFVISIMSEDQDVSVDSVNHLIVSDDSVTGILEELQKFVGQI